MPRNKPGGEYRPRPSKHVSPTGPAGKARDEYDLYEMIGSLAEPAFVLILDSIQDPHNLGACLRTADAAGLHGVVVPRDRAVGLTPTVRQISAGAADNIPLYTVVNLARTMDKLRELGLWLVGTADAAGQSMFEVDLTGPLGVVMGSEGKGVRRLTAEKCDFLVSIPMLGKVECLNVSVATGVMLFEAVRQRIEKGK